MENVLSAIRENSHITQAQLSQKLNRSDRQIRRVIKELREKDMKKELPLKCLFCYAEKGGMRDIMKMESDQEQEYFCMLKEE